MNFFFSRDRPIECSPSLTFNNILTPQTNSQNLGMHLDKKLNFEKKHLSQFELKGNKIIGIIPKLQNVLPRSALLIIYKSFIRPHLDYEDIIYYKANNEFFHVRLESFQYNTTLTITRAIRGFFTEKICELG